MAYVIGSAAGHLTPLYPTHRKDVDILASHALIADLRKHMVSETGYDEKKRLREAIAKVQKAIISDERARTVLDGRQPEPLDVNIEGLQSVHHTAQGPGPKQEPIVKGGKGKGKKGEKGGKGGSPSDLVRAIVHLSHRQKQRLMLGRLRWRLMQLRLSRRRLGSR